MTGVCIEPIGWVRGGRIEAVDDDWESVQATIELDERRFGPESLTGLDAFSHITVVFHFHAQAEQAVVAGARHPRGRKDWPKVGIFAQRGKARPNRIGVSVCRLRGVEGGRISVQGLDAIDGSPYLEEVYYFRLDRPEGYVLHRNFSDGADHRAE